MSKAAKIWIIAGVSLLLALCIIFGGVMTMLNWDFSKLSTLGMETNEYEITEQFKDIRLSTKLAKVDFITSEDEKARVICFEQKKVKHSVRVDDNALVIETVDNRKWYEHIGINFSSPKITVYLPKGEYGKFSLDSRTGDITLKSVEVSGLDMTVSVGHITAENINCSGDVSVKSSTGEIKLSKVKCKNLTSTASTGDLALKDVLVENTLSAKASTGNIELNESDAAELYITTSTGNVTGNLLSDKIFITKTSTGKIEVPNSITGGRCEITTSTGNIRVSS